jgi:hypothetical protein
MFIIKMTCKINIIVIINGIDLNISCNYSHNHMIGMDKISFSDIGSRLIIGRHVGM